MAAAVVEEEEAVATHVPPVNSDVRATEPAATKQLQVQMSNLQYCSPQLAQLAQVRHQVVDLQRVYFGHAATAG